MLEGERRKRRGRKVAKNDRPARRILFMTGPGKTLIVRDKANSKKEAYKRERTRKRERGWEEEAGVEPVSREK